jgi:hypothetical protein
MLEIVCIIKVDAVCLYSTFSCPFIRTSFERMKEQGLEEQEA